MSDRRLILASGSPRRAELMRRAGYSFEVIEPGFDEGAHDSSSQTVKGLVKKLAAGKARSVAEKLDDGIVIGADTLAELNKWAIGKPDDREDAERILSTLLGRAHRTLTAVCVIDAASGREKAFVVAAKVKMGKISDEALASYLDSGAWEGKAGGYNLDEMRGVWPIEVKGDETAVVGLPMRRLVPLLRKFDATLPSAYSG